MFPFSLVPRELLVEKGDLQILMICVKSFSVPSALPLKVKGLVRLLGTLL